MGGFGAEERCNLISIEKETDYRIQGQRQRTVVSLLQESKLERDRGLDQVESVQ